MNITPSEIHFAIRNFTARLEWLKDNPEDFSEEENEAFWLNSFKNKLENLSAKIDSELKKSIEEKKC